MGVSADDNFAGITGVNWDYIQHIKRDGYCTHRVLKGLKKLVHITHLEAWVSA